MNKFFKFLGIGTAIGTVVYGVIKYKNDQKFKEKVDEVVDKAADFAADHPILTTAVFATVVMVPIMAVRKAMDPAFNVPYDYYENDDSDEECNRINEEARAAAQKRMMMDDVLANPSDYVVVSKNEWEKYQDAQKDVTNEINTSWTEDYRDTWDEIHELVNRIDLAPGETYVLEEASQLGVEANKPVISHLVYGTGCYPPEVDEDRFVD